MRKRIAITVLLIVSFAMGPVNRPPAAAAQNRQPQNVRPPEQMRVDINHATREELLQVPGMTRGWAERIVRFRPYHTKQDLLDRGIVSGELYNRIKDYIIAHRGKQ